MAKRKKRTAKPVAWPVSEPELVVKPKSRGRRYAEIGAWSVAVLWLYFSFRFYIGGWISAFLSPSFQASLKHVPDYSLGFLPRILSGQLLTLFSGGSMTGPAAGAYFITGYVITYGLLSIILGMLISKAINAKNYLLAVFPLLIIFTPASVWVRFISSEHLDTLMFFFTLSAFFLIRHEKLMWFVPVCACLGIMTSYSYVPLFFPVIFALQYYEFIKSGMKRIRLFNLIATTATACAMELYMLWALFHSELVSKYSFAEAIAYLEKKAGHTFSDIELWYFSTAVLGRHMDGQMGTPIEATILSRYGWFNPKLYVNALWICAPILIFILPIWRKHMKSEQGFWKKSPYLLFMLAPAIIFPVYLFFGDVDRLVSAVLFSQILLLANAFFTDEHSEAFIRLKEIGRGRYRWLLYAAVILGVIVPLLVFRGFHWLDSPLNLSPFVNMAE